MWGQLTARRQRPGVAAPVISLCDASIGIAVCRLVWPDIDSAVFRKPLILGVRPPVRNHFKPLSQFLRHRRLGMPDDPLLMVTAQEGHRALRLHSFQTRYRYAKEQRGQ